jgi:hypothetical protein
MDYKKFTKQLSSKLDYARSNLFEMTISVPDSTDVESRLPMMIKTTQLPGKQLGEIQVKRFGAGFKMANDVILDVLSITVMCSSDMSERRFFHDWIERIYGAGGEREYRMAYYDEYAATATITTFDRQFHKKHNIQLQEVWPNSIGPVELSWESSEVSTFTVNLTYRNWVEVEVETTGTTP